MTTFDLSKLDVRTIETYRKEGRISDEMYRAFVEPPAAEDCSDNLEYSTVPFPDAAEGS
jgi:hypothetical protein